jgi:hypothetical protein
MGPPLPFLLSNWLGLVMLRQHLAEAEPTGPIDAGIAKSKTSKAP